MHCRPLPRAAFSAHAFPSRSSTLVLLATLAAAGVFSSPALAQAGPTISSTASTRFATAGRDATFGVTASGSGPLTYQWRRNGFPLAGATDSTFTLSAVTRADADVYDVVVTDATGSRTSGPMEMQVQARALPQILHLDATFPTMVQGTVEALAALRDGQILIAGSFSSVNDIARSSIARLNADGTLDASFTASVDRSISAVAVQGDGRIVIGGQFDTVNGVARPGIARLNADGSLDATFNPGVGSGIRNGIFLVRALPGGNVLLGGSGSFNDRSGRRIVRLLPNGTVDPDFVAFGSTPQSFFLTDLLVAPDGRLLYSNDGSLSSGDLKPAVLGRLARNGEIDPTFTPGVVTRGGNGVDSIAPLFNSGYLIGGSFTDYNGTTRARLVRLDADGKLDATFNPTLSSTNPIVQLLPARADATYVLRRSNLVGTALTPFAALSRIDASGALDPAFAVAFTAELVTPPPFATRLRSIAAMLLLDDGNMLLGGDTFRDGDVVRTGLIRTRAGSGVTFLLQPASTTLRAGASATLVASAVGAPDLRYQWFKDGTAIAGAQQQGLTLSGAQAGAAGAYFVRVTHAGGTLDSRTAQVTITESAPTFGQNNSATTFGSALLAGTRFALTAPSVTAGTAPLSYQWFKDGEPLPGETNAALFRAAWSTADSGTYSVVVSNALGSVISAPVAQTVANSPSWDWRLPRAFGNPLTSVHFFNGTFFATGARGTLLRATTPTEWTSVSIPTSANLGPMAYGNSHYVVLASSGGIFSSSNGSIWTSYESGIVDGRSLTQVAFGGDRFVAVGTRGAAVQSTDGTTWAPVTLPTNESLVGIAHGADTWVAVSALGSIYTSRDASTWTAQAPLPNAVYSGLAFGAGVFVAVAGGSGAALTSPDGITWTSRPYSAANSGVLASLQFTDAGFLAPFAGTAGRYLVSADGLTWREEQALGSSLSTAPTCLTSGNGLLVMSAGAPDFLLIGAGGGLRQIGSPEPRPFRAVAASPTLAVAVGSGQVPIGPARSASIYSSGDGLTWTLRNSGVSGTLNDVAHGANTFVAVGLTGTVLTSIDGQTWTARTSGTARALRGIVYGDRQFVAVGDGGAVLVSGDGITWSSVNPSFNLTLFEIAYGAGRYVAVGSDGTALVSTDARTWTQHQTRAGTLIDVAFGAGTFVAIGANGRVATSPDGATWTERTFNAPTLAAVSFANNRFIALGSGASYYTSSDGATWTPGQHGSAIAMNDVVEFRGGLIAVGNSGSIISEGAFGDAQLANLSVRAQLSARQRLAVGVTVSGGTRRILFRAAGPGLGRLGLAGFMPEPRLELYQGSAIVSATSNWLATTNEIFASVGAFPFAAGSSDSAFQRPLTGGHSVVTWGPEGGIVLLESYDLGTGGDGRLSNLSTRHRLTGGSDTLIAGFFIHGTGEKRLLVRAVGPTLASLGVTDYLSDPRLALYASNGIQLAENNDWTPNLAGVFASVGAFALEPGSRDAALVARVQAGRAYTVQATSGTTAAGETLLEIYELP